MRTFKGSLLKISILFLILFSSVQISFAQKWADKSILKIDEAWEEGDYITAVKENIKFEKKLRKKVGAQSELMLVYYLKTARNNLANGYLKDFELNVDRSIDLSKRLNGETSDEYGLTLLEISKMLILAENYHRALEYLNQATDILSKSGELSEEYRPLIDLEYVAIYISQGYYNQAIEFINRNEPYFQERAVSKVSVVDSKGKLTTENLPEKEALERLNDYANLMNLKSRAYWKKGSFLSADSAFMRSKQWIEDQRLLGKNSLAWIRNHLWQWQMLTDYGVERKEARSNFEDALARLKNKHTESHYMALQIYESLLRLYLANNDEARFKNLKVEYERVIKKYFKSTSMHAINLEVVEMNSKLDKAKTKNLEAKTLALLSDTDALPQYHPKRIEILDFLYRVAVDEQRYSDAEGYLTQTLEQKEVLYGKETVEYHLSLVKMAGYLLDYTNKLEEAVEIYSTSWENIVEPEITFGHVDYTDILNHLAKYYILIDEYDKASDILDQALLATRTVYDNQDFKYGNELEQIAYLQIQIGEFEKADVNLAEAMIILENERKNPDGVIYFIKALETSAKLNSIKGDYDQAEKDLNLSRRLFPRATNLSGYDELASMVDLADLYINFGQYKKTDAVLQEALYLYENIYGLGSRNLVIPLVSMGQLKIATGDYTEGEKYALRANDIARNFYGEESTKTATTYKLLSEVYSSIGDYEKAEENVRKALVVQEEQFGRNHIEVANSLSQLGIVKFYKEDDPREVEPIFNEASEIIDVKLGSNTPLYANVLTDLAVLYIAERRYSEAFGALNRAFSIWEERVGRKNNINKANIYILNGDIYYFQRDYVKAEQNYMMAKNLYENFFKDDHPEYVKVLSKLSKVYYMEGDSRKAKNTIEEALDKYDNFIKVYFPALSERQKAKFWNTIRPDYEFYNTLSMELMDEFSNMRENMMNNALTTKALLLSASLKIRESILNGNDEVLKAKYNEWIDQKEFLTAALSMSKEQLEENDINVDALLRDVETIEKEISEKSTLFDNSFKEKQITWEEVQDGLDSNEVAIEMVRFRYFDHVFTDSIIYVGLYVKNEKSMKEPGIVVLKNGYELENRYYKVYRNSIKFKVDDKYSYGQFWEPIVQQVGNTSTIYFSGDGVYNQINLEAIPTNDGKYVLDNSNIILVSNTKDVYLSKSAGVKDTYANNATMFGNPIFYVSAGQHSYTVGQLPGTEKEIEELNTILDNYGWETQKYLETAATEERIKELENPKVFHIATHGFFTPAAEIESNVDIQGSDKAVQNPLLRTGLMLAGAGDLLDQNPYNYNIDNGILTAYEAMNLNFDQTDLVVLSACETALGDLSVGEGVYGLQRAFIVAGANTLIMSLFKVDDIATQKLMVSFYNKWLETGNKRQAFIDAKKEIRNEFKDPIYWGAFVMIGLD